jgi:signal transduction histidine kinase
MRFAPRLSVGAQLTATILLAIALTWICSAGTSSYVAYQRMRALRQQMLARPDLYPVPIPEPRFTVWDFLLGPRPQPARPPIPGAGLQPPPQGMGPAPPPGGAPPGAGPRPPDGPRPPGPGGLGPGAMLAVRGAIALLLALMAGKYLSWRFSSRLEELAKGAGAFDSGDLSYRVPESGDDEFARVAAAMNRMAERVARQIGDLQRDADSRRQFLADVAHELRGPVATIRTMAGALEDGLADEPQRRERAVGALVRTSERLLNLVNDLLMLARLDLKELPINVRRADIGELAAGAVESHAAAASQAGVTLLPIEPGEPVIASVDPDRLTQALDNLLDNAISHAGSGAKVRVAVEQGETARVTVSDDGQGIPANHLERIFEPFFRVDPARTMDEGHSGLGLRISRGLVRAMGGELTLASKQGAGTTAVITVPRFRPGS